MSTLLDTLTFLRPAWLLGLPVIPLWLWWLHRRRSQHGWHAVIPAHLLRPLTLAPQATPSSSGPSRWLALVLALALVALAGPSWQSRDQPVTPPSDALVIVLDVSLSMLGTDVAPDRMTLAKRKIQDVLRLREGAETALVAYAGDAHTVTPLTRDGRAITAFLPALDPFMMPAYGGRADLGVAQAVQLLDASPARHQQILLITDGVRERWHDPLLGHLQASGYPLAVLAVGTEQGSPIPLGDRGVIREGGEPVIVRTDINALRPLATGGRIQRATVNDRDLQHLAIAPRGPATTSTSDEDTVTVRDDGGYWLLFALIPLILLVWRRYGLSPLLPVVMTGVMVGTWPTVSWASGLSTLFDNADQRGKRLLVEEPATAAEQFRSAAWTAVAHYRAGDYEAAIRHWEARDDRDAHFNRGNALARSGQLADAIDAYEQALAKDSDFVEARENRDLIQSLLAADDADDGQQEPAERAEEPADEDGNADEPSPSAGQEERPEQGLEEDLEDDQDSAEWEQQRHEQWLRRIPVDPAHLLKRKFEREHQQRQRQPNAGDTDELW